MTFRLLLGALAIAIGLAQIPAGPGSGAGESEKGAEKAAPVIPLELQLEYFRTDGALAHLRAELAEAQTDYEAAVKAVVKACGEGAAPVLTQDKKHLFCVAQSTPAQPAARK